MQAASTREVKGIVRRLNRNGTGVIVDGEWLNWGREFFLGKRTPSIGESWKFLVEDCSVTSGDTVPFVREAVFISEAIQPLLQVLEPESDRPHFEDQEWF